MSFSTEARIKSKLDILYSFYSPAHYLLTGFVKGAPNLVESIGEIIMKLRLGGFVWILGSVQLLFFERSFVVVAQVLNDLPLLDDNTNSPLGHLGVQVGFDEYPSNIQTLVDARLEELYSIGMNVGRIQLDWVDLEPQPSQYDSSSLQEALEGFPDSIKSVFLLIAAVDSEGVSDVRPPDLQETPFSNEVVTRFQSMLDTIVFPTLITTSQPVVYLLSVGNEPGGYLEDNPSELTPIADFTRQIASYVHDNFNPQLAVGLTMDNVYKEIADASDVVIFNQYGLKSDLTAIDDPQDFVTALHQRQDIIGRDRAFVIQELGMPSGWEEGQSKTSVMNTNPTYAAQVTQVMLKELRDNPQWKGAFWFTMIDWSISTTEFYGELLTQAGLEEFFVLRVEEWLRTGGLLRYEQENYDEIDPRPVWDVFLNGMKGLYDPSSFTRTPSPPPSQDDPSDSFTPTPSPPPTPDDSSDSSFVDLLLFPLYFLLALCVG